MVSRGGLHSVVILSEVNAKNMVGYNSCVFKKLEVKPVKTGGHLAK